MTNMRFFSIVSFFLLIGFYSMAQVSFDNAILVKDFNKGDKYTKLLHQNLLDYNKNFSANHVYDWSEQLKLVQPVDNKELKKPVRYINYALVAARNVIEKPVLNLRTDTSGKTLEAFYEINPIADLMVKTIDLQSSEILNFFSSELSISSETFGASRNLLRINVPKFNEEFGGDPAKIKKANSDQYAKLEEAVYLKFQKKILENISEIIQIHSQKINSEASYFFTSDSFRNYKVIKDEQSKDEKKIKYIKFEIPKGEKLKPKSDLYLYKILNIGNKKSIKYINYFVLEEVSEQVGTAKLFAFGNKKDIAEAMSEDDPLLFFSSREAASDYNKTVINNIKPENVAVRKNCIFCNYYFEKTLLTVPTITVMERNAPELKIFQEMAKLDKFIDYNSEELLNKQLGVKYLFYTEASKFMATDIETGRVIGSESIRNPKSPPPSIVKNLFIETFNKPIEFLRNEDVSKNKVNDILVYSDFGFLPGEKLKVYVLEEEKVGTKVLKRKVEIGSGYIQKNVSDFVSKLNIRDGEKSIFQAQADKKEIFFEYIIK